jgi:Tc5 transposase DNA-binding domain
MPRPQSQKATESEEKVLEVLTGLQSGLYRSVYQAARETGTSESTIKRRRSGGKTRSEAHESQQLFSKPQEKALTTCITDLTATGYPAHHDFIRDMAEVIRKQNRIDNAIKHLPRIGERWVRQFIKRHPYLKTILSRSIEAARIKDVTAKVIVKWFKMFEEVIEEHQITMENIYNMDETGINFLQYH